MSNWSVESIAIYDKEVKEIYNGTPSTKNLIDNNSICVSKDKMHLTLGYRIHPAILRLRQLRARQLF